MQPGGGVDLVGRGDLIRAELERHTDAAALDVRVIEAPDVIEMSDRPSAVLRRRKASLTMRSSPE